MLCVLYLKYLILTFLLIGETRKSSTSHVELLTHNPQLAGLTKTRKILLVYVIFCDTYNMYNIFDVILSQQTYYAFHTHFFLAKRYMVAAKSMFISISANYI